VVNISDEIKLRYYAYELAMYKEKRSLYNSVGIKNSWKYEKDLVIIFNVISP